MVSYIKFSDIRERLIASGDILVARTLAPDRISARRYAFQFGVACATAWAPSTFERIVVDGLQVLFDASSNEIRVGRTSASTTPKLFQLLLELARSAPDPVPYERLDDFPVPMEALAFNLEPRVPIHKRKSRLSEWLKSHDFPLNVYNVHDFGYGLRRSR